MNREELYHKTVNVLLDAYNDGELEHGNCSACAVGNICKEAAKMIRVHGASWSALFQTNAKGSQLHLPEMKIFFQPDGYALVLLIEYNITDLAKIEFAFESSLHKTDEGYEFWTSSVNKKQGQYIGLCGVLDVLKEIHEQLEKVHEVSKARLLTIKELVTA